MSTNKPTRAALEAQVKEAKRTIEQVPGAYRQTGMIIRLEQAAARLGLKVPR